MIVRWLTLLLTSLVLQSSNNPVQFIVPGLEVSPSNTIDLPVSIQTNNNIVGSLEFELNYDQSILEFYEISVSSKAQQWLTYTMETGNGKVRWGGYDSTFGEHSITNPTELFILKFNVIDPNWSQTPITIGRKTAGDVEGWDLEVINTDGYINQNRMALPLDEDGIRGKAYPIPTNNIVKVEASIPASGYYNIIIYDLGGNILYKTNIQLIKGLVTLEQTLQDYSDGVYLLQISNSKFAKTFKLIKN